LGRKRHRIKKLSAFFLLNNNNNNNNPAAVFEQKDVLYNIH
jgi:hypothetical protein